MSTMMACDDATNTLEQQYLTALQNATVWAIQDGSLELRDDGGALQVSFVPRAAVAGPADPPQRAGGIIGSGHVP